MRYKMSNWYFIFEEPDAALQPALLYALFVRGDSITPRTKIRVYGTAENEDGESRLLKTAGVVNFCPKGEDAVVAKTEKGNEMVLSIPRAKDSLKAACTHLRAVFGDD